MKHEDWKMFRDKEERESFVEELERYLPTIEDLRIKNKGYLETYFNKLDEYQRIGDEPV